MDKIEVSGIRLFAYHGCLEEEARIGSDYLVDVNLWGNLEQAAAHDQLRDTLDYVTVYQVVEEEMAVRSDLIEHVARRILDRLFECLAPLQEAEVRVSKCAPPINGDVAKVSAVLKRSRPL